MTNILLQQYHLDFRYLQKYLHYFTIRHLISLQPNKQTFVSGFRLIKLSGRNYLPAWHGLHDLQCLRFFASERWNLLHFFWKKGFFYETYQNFWKLCNLLLFRWNQPSSKKHFSKPTIRIQTIFGVKNFNEILDSGWFFCGVFLFFEVLNNLLYIHKYYAIDRLHLKKSRVS